VDRRRLVALALVALAATSCDTDDGRQLREPTSEQRAAATTTSTTTTVPLVPGEINTTPTTATTTAVVASAFSLEAPWPLGAPIDARFTCDGEDRSPTLIWTAPPSGTVELALLVTDDDADGFVHWAVAGIDPTAGEVGEGGTIIGAVEGRNDFGNPGWGGPCPPSGTHTYRFTLYALGQQAELPDDFTGDDLEAVANSTSLAVAETTGTYTRA
jgi:Raf kinase inhibitor-like YbhB/YbcL family protein